jgi:serine/threonine protein kinase/sugar lactone lactonase YvrE
VSLDPSTPQPPAFTPPVSTFAGPVAELIAQQMLAPPVRPGLLATLNQFEIQRLLGGGGMGIVLLARDSLNAQSVAIKMVRPELVTDQRIIHRFVREAGHLQKLKHPNVVPVLEVSNRAAGPYFVMPWFERGSVAKSIRPGRPLDTVFILDIALCIAAGLQFAHRRGIIHRDLKPANILLTGQNQACLADFGLARSMFNDTMVDVESRQVEGTAPYMSPGVAAGDAEDTRCDIYAFGALLYEMLTGEPPYAAATLQEIRRQILAGPPKPIRERNPAADASLAAVAQGAMARELRDRYAEMTDVLADLQRINEGKPPVGPRGLVRDGLRQVRRVSHLAWLAAGAAVIGVVIWIVLHPNNPPENKVIAQVPPPTNQTVIVVKTNPVPQPSNSIPQPTNPPPVVVKTPPDLQTHYIAAILAGQPGTGGSTDGDGAAARFLAPGGLVADGAGNLYVADTGNNTIRKITPDGVVITLAGQPGAHGSHDGLGSAASFFAPFGIAVDKFGNIYVAEVGNCAIRTITPVGLVKTLAGLAGNPGANDGVGDNAQFRNPFGIAVDNSGAVYVADTGNSTIRKITPLGAVTTLAGLALGNGNTDGTGGNARFWQPQGVALDKSGNIYVADTGNNALRKIIPVGTNWLVTQPFKSATLGNPGSIAATSPLKNPQSLSVDDNASIYVADADNLAIRILSSPGAVTTVAFTGDLGHPDALTVDGRGNIYVADTPNNVIRKLTPVTSSDLR